MERTDKMKRANIAVALIVGGIALFFYVMAFVQHW
jgi:hypothetical protein